MDTKSVDILAIGVHPDDIELGAGGTIALHLDLGYRVAFCDLTQGELGTRGNGGLRLEEAEKAKQIFGIEERVNIGLMDGFFANDKESILSLIPIIRHFRPKIVLANAISDRHPDHGRAAKFISDACFYAGLIKIETQYKGIQQQAHRPDVVYHYIQDRNIKPDIVIDITPYMDKKIEAIMAFSSQFYDPKSKEPHTPISSLSFLQFVKAKAATYGREINAEYGEGFTVERAIKVNNLFAIE